jgi:hypothetical protein
MITSIVIIILSMAMFVYWFRYSCLLILESRLSEEEAKQGGESQDPTVAWLEVQLAHASTPSELDRVRMSLDRDLRVVQNLARSCSELQVAGTSLESRLLMIDYRMMQVWFAATRPFAGPKAQNALREMSRIVGYLAAESGVRLAAAEN